MENTRPSLVRQRELDKTYNQRMAKLPRRDKKNPIKPLEPQIVQEAGRDQEIYDWLYNVTKKLNALFEFAINGDDDIARMGLDDRSLRLMIEFVQSIRVEKIKNYNRFYGTVLELTEKIDSLLRRNLGPDINARLEELKESLFDCLE